ncbi:calmin isoform X1 [Podarcis lilfordi]|uniref:Calmin n=2 Tax=Podarcis lilfordi TaxID=74358 RepID=A0AA35NUD6_9SAUR|nr:calmin isoform X1 [Podarcis lilfordi]
MAGNEWDWFQREELIGQISDIRVQNLQVERENVQKRTFTRWINLHLEKCSPPLEVKDLLVDVKDGKILMALLEVLSGQNLLHEYKPSTHRIFRLNNIAKALKFLEDSNVKLVSIDAAEIADGNSSMVLGLIWNIILFFQIKELTGNLNRNSSSSSLSSGPSGPDSDTSHPNTPNVERSMSVSVKDQRKAIKTLLNWVQRKTRKYGVAVQDFTSSWRSGLAFLAVIKAIDSSLVDMKQALEKSPRENLEDAFTTAHNHLGIPRLLEPEDIMVESPDDQSIVTYVAQFLEHFPELEGEDFSDPDKDFAAESPFHVKGTPGEENQGKVLILNENGKHTYTGHLDRSQSSPPKIYIPGSPLNPENPSFHMANEEINDNLQQQLSDHSETSTEEPQRPSSLPITKPVDYRSNSAADILANNVNGSEGDQLSMSDSPTQSDDLLPPSSPPYHKHSVEPADSSGVNSEEFSKNKPATETKESSDGKPCSSPLPENVPEHLTTELEHPIPAADEQDSTKKYILELLNKEISKLPEKYDHAMQSSSVKEGHATHQETGGPDFNDNSEECYPLERFSPVRNTPKSLDITNEDSSVGEMMPNPSKISIIPHDLFYYPHYDVPISDVLDAFATPGADPTLSENNKICAELLVNCLAEKELLDQNAEKDISKAGLHTSNAAPTALDDKSPEKQKKDARGHTKASLNKAAAEGKNVILKANSVDSAHSDVPVIVVNQFDTAAEERKLPEERSKKKEKRKNKSIFQGENNPSPKAGSTRLLDKLEEESTDHQGLSRVSHSDPNVVSQRYLAESTSKELGSTDVPKSTATSEIASSSSRKRKDLEKKDSSDKASVPTPSPRTDQPELFYFIVFLWVLVYCLLLLPQLVSSPL